MTTGWRVIFLALLCAMTTANVIIAAQTRAMADEAAAITAEITETAANIERVTGPHNPICRVRLHEKTLAFEHENGCSGVLPYDGSRTCFACGCGVSGMVCVDEKGLTNAE